MGAGGGRMCGSVGGAAPSPDENVVDGDEQDTEAQQGTIDKDEEIERLTAEIAALKAQRIEGGGVVAETSVLDVELRKREEEIKQLRDELDRIKPAMMRVKETQSKLEILERDRNEMEKKLQLSTSLSQKQKERQERLQADLASKKLELDAANKELNDVRASLKQMQNDHGMTLREFQEHHEDAVGRMVENQAKLSSQVAAMDSDGQKPTHVRTSSDIKATIEVTNRLDQLEKQLDAMNEEGSKSLERQIAELENEIKAAREQSENQKSIPRKKSTNVLAATLVQSSVQVPKPQSPNEQLPQAPKTSAEAVAMAEEQALEERLADDALWSDDEDDKGNDDGADGNRDSTVPKVDVSSVAQTSPEPGSAPAKLVSDMSLDAAAQNSPPVSGLVPPLLIDGGSPLNANELLPDVSEDALVQAAAEVALDDNDFLDEFANPGSF